MHDKRVDALMTNAPSASERARAGAIDFLEFSVVTKIFLSRQTSQGLMSWQSLLGHVSRQDLGPGQLRRAETERLGHATALTTRAIVVHATDLLQCIVLCIVLCYYS